MRQRRVFTKEFKREVVQDILSGTAKPGQLCRRYQIAYPVIARWQEDYAKGKLENEPVNEEGLRLKIEQLERMIGQLTMDNAILKKALKQTVCLRNKNESLSVITSGVSAVSGGGVRC